jgi:hypothetical protein
VIGSSLGGGASAPDGGERRCASGTPDRGGGQPQSRAWLLTGLSLFWAAGQFDKRVNSHARARHGFRDSPFSPLPNLLLGWDGRKRMYFKEW